MTDYAPLTGIKVLELANVVSGPTAGKLLSDLGADVLKIEKPGSGDPFRKWDVFAKESNPSFNALNRGKRSMTLDLHAAEAQEIVKRLVASYDIVLENFRPSFLPKLGLDYESLVQHNSRLIYCSIRGLGYEDERPCYDAVAQAKSGLMSQFTDLNDPVPMGPALADHQTGFNAAMAVLAAIIRRSHLDEPQHIEVTMLGSLVALQESQMSNFRADGRIANATSRPHGSQSFGFVAGDGLPLAIHLSSVSRFWINLTKVVERPDLVEDERFAQKIGRVRNYDALHDILNDIFRKRTREEWLKRLEDGEVPAAPILNVSETVVDEDIRALGVIRTFGEGDREYIGISTPVRAPWNQTGSRLPVATLGEHTQETLHDLGYTEPEVNSLLQAGIA